MKEIFKPVVGFEGKYEVSNLGRVKSLKRSVTDSMGRIKSFDESFKLPTLASTGYLIVSLRDKSKRKSDSIHRLVALAFIPNPENKPEVNHINGDKKDNRVDNLEWVTRSENFLHAYRTGLNKGRGGVGNKLTSEDVSDIRAKYTPFKYTQSKLAKEYGVTQSVISRIICNKAW